MDNYILNLTLIATAWVKVLLQCQLTLLATRGHGRWWWIGAGLKMLCQSLSQLQRLDLRLVNPQDAGGGRCWCALSHLQRLSQLRLSECNIQVGLSTAARSLDSK